MQQAPGRGGERHLQGLAQRTDPGQARRPCAQLLRRGKGAWLFKTANLLSPPTQESLREWEPNAERGLMVPQQPHAYIFFPGPLLWHKDIHTEGRLANWLLNGILLDKFKSQNHCFQMPAWQANTGNCEG